MLFKSKYIKNKADTVMKYNSLKLEFQLQCINGVGALKLLTMNNVIIDMIFQEAESADERERDIRDIIRFYKYAKLSICNKHEETFRFIESLNPVPEPSVVRDAILGVMGNIEEDMVLLGQFYSKHEVDKQRLKWDKFTPYLYSLDIPIVTDFKLKCLADQSAIALINRYEAAIIFLRNAMFIPEREINKTHIDNFYYYARERIELNYIHFLYFIKRLDYDKTETRVKEAISTKISDLKKDMKLIGKEHRFKEFNDTIRRWE